MVAAGTATTFTEREYLALETVAEIRPELVEATSEYCYPDVVVVCAKPTLVEPSPRSLVNPEIIVEVLSPTTERYERGAKWVAYQQMPTLTDYLLVAETSRKRSPLGPSVARAIPRGRTSRAPRGSGRRGRTAPR